MLGISSRPPQHASILTRLGLSALEAMPTPVSVTPQTILEARKGLGFLEVTADRWALGAPLQVHLSRWLSLSVNDHCTIVHDHHLSPALSPLLMTSTPHPP